MYPSTGTSKDVDRIICKLLTLPGKYFLYVFKRLCIKVDLTYSKCDPYVQLCVLLFENTDDLISFRKLIEIKLDHLKKKTTNVLYKSSNKINQNTSSVLWPQ